MTTKLKKESNIEDYIALHNDGIPLNRVNPIDDQTFEVLRGSNVDIRIIDRDQNLERLYRLTHISGFSKDTAEHSHRYFYSIPLQTVTGTIVGFIYRTVFSKNYTTVIRKFSKNECKVPIMFGWYKDFADFEQHEVCRPIVVCEGLKDCITLKKIYPYVLSNNTSHMGMNLEVLSNLTNKFILIYDNDRAGEEGTLTDITEAQKKRFNVLEMKLNYGYKDITDCSEDKTYFEEIKNQLLHAISSLEDEKSSNNYSTGRADWAYRS